MSLEAAERIAAKPWFLAAFNGALVVAWLLWGVDVANIIISIVTAEILLLGLGAQRRANLATQAKLDEIVHATADARDDIAHIEDLAEDEIERKRL